MLVTALAFAILMMPSAVPSNSSSCSTELVKAGLCTGGGSEIIIDGIHNTPGDPGDSGTWPIGDSDPDPGVSPSPPPGVDLQNCLLDWDSYVRCFRTPDEGEEEPEEEAAAPSIPPITIADIARFAPAGSAIAGEPDNVGVVGLPTNFVATASVHTVNASLFGFPVAVRFTPAGYDFSFGDGTGVTTTAGGQTWAALGQAQFTPTPTSHAYVERGTYSAQVDLRYTAEVDFGIGWFPISGEVTSVGAPQQVRIFEAHTALVAHTCQQAPDSPGC